MFSTSAALSEIIQGGAPGCSLLLQVPEPSSTVVSALTPAPPLADLGPLLPLPQLPLLALPALPRSRQLGDPEQPRTLAPRAGLLAELDAALPALAERGRADFSGLPDLGLGLPSLPIIGQVDAAQAPAQAAVAPQPEQAQAPDPFLLPRPELGLRLPNITLPTVLRLSLPNLQLFPGQEDPSLALASGAGQAPAPSAQHEANLQVPRFTLPDVALPSLPSLPPLGALARDPAVRQASLEAQAPVEDLSMAAFQLPDVTLPQLGLPLLAQPQLPSLPFGQAPAESPALPAFPALANLAASNAARSRSVQGSAQPEASATPASGLPSSSALFAAEGAFAPAASGLQAGVDSALRRLADPVSLPQLGLPLLTLPGLSFGQAPAGSAALPFASLADFAAADTQSPRRAQATAAVLDGSSAAFTALGSALAPSARSAQALLAGISKGLPQLRDPARSLPQLGVPLLALPGAQLSASAPALDLAAAQSPMTDLSQLSSIAPLAPDQAPDGQVGAPSQQPLPVPSTAPAQQGLDAAASLARDLPGLALPQLPLFSGLAQAPASLLQGSQSPDLAHSPPQPADSRTRPVPSSPPQTGLPPA